MNKIPQFKDMIIYEDENFIFINKPAGISSLNERDISAVSIQKISKKYLPESMLCHRIDKETSGVLILAKNEQAYRETALKFESREISKTYHAVVEGQLNTLNKLIDIPLAVTKNGKAKIDYKSGKNSQTIFSTLKIFTDFTLLECKPVTGRLHQIRIHIASQNFPITGDVEYGGHIPMLSSMKKKFNSSKNEEEKGMIQRVALHAYSVSYSAFEKVYEIVAPYPDDFKVLLKNLEKYNSR